jgi:hypothetical protein
MNKNIYITNTHDGIVYQATPCEMVENKDIISMVNEHRLLVLKLQDHKINEVEFKRLGELDEFLLSDLLEDFKEVGGQENPFYNTEENTTMLYL